MADVQPQPRRRRTAPAAAAVHDQPLGSVTITAREIYDAVMALTARVDTALDRSEQTAKAVEDHEVRLRRIEDTRWPVQGVNALLALAAIVVAIIALFHA